MTTKGVKRPKMVYRQLGENNTNWKESKVAQTGRGRAERIYQHPIPCKICCDPKSERHHIDGNTLNNSPANIDWLCRKHHMEADGRMDRWRSIERPRNTMRDEMGRFRPHREAEMA